MHNNIDKFKLIRSGVMAVMVLFMICGCGCRVYAGMNLETDAAVSGISVALNNYYARTMEPESAFAESVRMVANDTIVVTEDTNRKTTKAVQKLVDEVTPVEETIVKEGEGGLTWGTVKGTKSLRLRDKPDPNAKTLTLLAEGEHYVVTGQEGQFLKIQVDDDLEGYVFKDYIDTSISYDEELAREKEKLAAQAAAAKKEAAEAMKKLEEAKKAEKSSDASNTETLKNKETETETVKTEKVKESETEKKKETESAASNSYETVEAINWDDEEDENNEEPGEVIEAPDFDEEMNAGSDDETDEEDEETEEEFIDEPETVEAPGDTVESSESSGPGGVADATRTAMVAYAKQFLGNPYVYGGTSLTNGCDCSGFTMGIYSYFGMSIGRSSRDQAANGTEISPSEAQPGDLFFYDSNGTINHVAMYIGGGQVIHSSSTATGIKISNAYYRTPCKVCTYF